MKKEYDFTNAQQGKFYRPLNELDIPIYLDEDVKSFFVEKMKKTKDFYSKHYYKFTLKTRYRNL